MYVFFTGQEAWLNSPPRSDLRFESKTADGFGAREKDETTALLRELVGLMKDMNQRQAMFGKFDELYIMISVN
jgi:hypothetical protein